MTTQDNARSAYEMLSSTRRLSRTGALQVVELMLSVVRASLTVQLSNTHDETFAWSVLLWQMHVWLVMGHGDAGLVSVSKRQDSYDTSEDISSKRRRIYAPHSSARRLGPTPG